MRFGLIGVCVVIGIVAIGACGLFPFPQGSGTLRVLVTDKPFPFDLIDSAVVTLTRVEIRPAGADDQAADDETESDDTAEDADETESEQDANDTNDETAADETSGETNDETADVGESSASGSGKPTTTGPAEDSAQNAAQGQQSSGHGGFVVIFDDPAGKDFDLVQLHGGKTDLLADLDVPAGHYTQMRLIVTGGKVKLKDGREFTLTVPSGAQSGIKLNFEFDVVAGDQTELLLDIDLSRAFTPIPGGKIDDVSTIQLFHFSPAIAMRLIELKGTGNIAGTVTDEASNPISGAAVTVFDGATEVTTTSTGTEGTYTVTGLDPGTYRVEFSATDFLDAEVTDVAVNAGLTTENVDAVLQVDGG